jgi:peptide/nickel transport system substrate-binding protein
MRRIVFQLLAAASLLSVAAAVTRPHYGGTLRVALQYGRTELGVPANATADDIRDAAQVLALITDTLVKTDAQGHAAPSLATAWRSDSDARNWDLTLRPGVKFHDGSALSAASVAQILGPLHPDWKVRGSGDTLIIESDNAMPGLLAELALPGNAILKRNANGLIIGTGPFRIAEWQPGKTLKLVASEDCWSGRPFIDAVEVEFGKSAREQAIALELGKTDLIELSAASFSGTSQRVHASVPVELLALVFPPNSRAQDARVREALALSIDRKPIQSVLLKGAGEPAGSILPNWMTGYSAVFSVQANLQRAKALIAESRQPTLNMSYDPRDPQAQLIAERLALNAREAGLAIQVSLSGQADVSLVRIVLPSSDPATSLREAARRLGLPQPSIRSNSVEDLYQAERTMLDGHAALPLLHLPVACAASARLREWEPDRMGAWNLADAWLEANWP